MPRITKRDMEAIERLLHQRGRVRAVQKSGVAKAYGSVVNPVPAKKLEPEVLPPPPPQPVAGDCVAIVFPTCQAVGTVGLGMKDEAVAVAAALSDPLYDWMIRELGL